MSFKINTMRVTLALIASSMSFQTVGSPSNTVAVEYSGLTSDEWIEMSTQTSIPIEVLYAVALRESGYYNKETKTFSPTPNALAVGKELKVGQKTHVGIFDLNDDTKVTKLNELIGKGHTNLGIGMFQISYRFNRWRAEKPEDFYNPRINAKAAAEILSECKNRFTTLAKTLSCYRRGSVTEQGLEYSNEVFELSSKYGRRFAKAVTGQPSTFTYNRPAQYRPSVDVSLSNIELLKKYYQNQPVRSSSRYSITVINQGNR